MEFQLDAGTKSSFIEPGCIPRERDKVLLNSNTPYPDQFTYLSTQPNLKSSSEICDRDQALDSGNDAQFLIIWV